MKIPGDIFYKIILYKSRCSIPWVMTSTINIQIILTRKVHNNRSRLLPTYSKKVNRLFFKTWWLPKVKKGEVIGLERRFLCVSWFARYDKSFALDPFWPKEEREKNGWWCWPASFFPIKIQVDDRRTTGHTGNYGIHWILFLLWFICKSSEAKESRVTGAHAYRDSQNDGDASVTSFCVF